MNTIFSSFKLLVIATLLSLLAACGGSSNGASGEVLLTCSVPLIPNEAGTECVAPPPINCPPPTVPDENNESCVVGADPSLPDPTVFPGENQAVLYYNRINDASNTPNDPVYEGFRLHTWNNDECDAYAAPFDSTDWANGHEYDGIDPNYGAYWILDLKPGYSDCGNFIIHIGTEGSGKALGDADFKMPLMQDDEKFVRMNFTIHAEPSVFEYPILNLGERPVSIDGAAAHWFDQNTLVWNANTELVKEVKLHFSSTADLEVDLESGLNGDVVSLTSGSLSDEQKAVIPHLSEWPAYEGGWTAEQAKDMLKAQVVAAGYDSEGKLIQATRVQSAKALDAFYTMGENDADEAELGIRYSSDGITVAVWAPTAHSMEVKVYNDDKSLDSSNAMTFDEETGVWSVTLDTSVDRKFYRYALSVYHPISDKIEDLEATDPYSVNTSTNGRFSQFVDLSADDLKPDGWDDHSVPVVASPEGSVIYEGHVRDFSVRDNSTSAENRGKYLAFTEQDSAPMQHLTKLAESGLTHFHLLPVTDIATINEEASERVEIIDTLGTLCDAINDDADACKIEDKNKVIQDLLAEYLPGSDDAQKLVNALRGLDGFNWGYDPHHFMVPEGSYASNPEGVARIKEMRAMVQGLHEAGLRVVLDVVYNHTSSSGLWDNSVFDKLVPGYYHRYNAESGDIERSTCCENTATEHRMMDKFITDSLVTLTEQYGFDGYRFDIMGHMTKGNILNARDAVQAVDPDNYFYGEGWNFGEVADNRLFEQATQANMAGSEVGTFNDRIREAIRGGAFFSNENTDGNLANQDTLKLSMAGNLQDYILKDFNGNSAKGSSFSWNTQPTAYALDPADSIHYVSKHDNETLWDQMQYHHDTATSLEDRVRIHNVALALPIMSQGIPFLQIGGDLLRSKSMDRNSYDSGDWFNYVDFTQESNNWNVGLPLAQDNQGKWTEISAISANPMAAPSMTEISYATSVFSEFLKIRQGSELFKLATMQDVIDRVGFHNIGKRQQHGLIVMSIDDGIDLVDLDPQFDALVIVANGTEQTLSHTVPTAAGFELHPVLQSSVDAQQQGASFAQGEGEGTFTVPAYSISVFAKLQGEEQGEGLKANATAGAPDVVPYGSTEVFIRGSMNGWGTDGMMSYVGSGEYRIAITLAAGDYEFKVASEDWSSVDFGGLSYAEADIEENLAEQLKRSGSNLKFNAALDATYIFSLDASDKENPVLTLYNEEPFVGTSVFIRGSMNGWSEDDVMTYIGGGKYQMNRNLDAGDYEFKVASADWSTVDFGSGESEHDVTLGTAKLLAAKGVNMTLAIPSQGEYSFIFDFSNRNEPLLTVHAAQMFGDTPVFVRGSMNGWGTDNMLSYQGNSVYTMEREIEAGDYEFKIASEDWNTIDLGAPAEFDSLTVDQMMMLQPVGGNIKLNIDETANYRFTITGPDAKNPSLIIEKLQTPLIAPLRAVS